MSWNWKEDEEVKTYEQHGTVTISTEEYRDLIRCTFELKIAGQKEHDDWYNEYQKNRKLEEEMKLFKDKVAELNEWLASDEAALTKFKLWKTEKRMKEEEE